MSFHIALSLRITHDYWSDEAPPLRIVPHSPTAFASIGLLAKPATARLDVVAETKYLEEPVTVTLAVIADEGEVAQLTSGADWTTCPRADLTSDTASTTAVLSDIVTNGEVPRAPGDPLFLIDVSLPATGQRDVDLHCPSVAAIWAYHIIGKSVDAPLQITDQKAQVNFEDAGQTALPNGTPARVLRSTQPIALQRRADTRFALEQTQEPPFDPITLVPVLPAAGTNLRPIPGGSPDTTMQSDIFVSLW
ncbi:hypothetical protein [Yoonia sediminilitoris]|uniref:Uncharacterized protein n=1 Tax=Yoonia sediminilitoris TaxID=1286148 RepID=A0A2T6KME1_9RHOB|nr:hypothetical protein [Yoonia sediminilitoris]PUB17376.1 hypothetical protein C8N45_102388 [Yoonia sediminilitoris]RCW97671.1 hypothetical protein DFP92_102388 [Yoonia sediminilitoris]